MNFLARVFLRGEGCNNEKVVFARVLPRKEVSKLIWKGDDDH